MIPIGKKDPAFEEKKRKASMPPMLMVGVSKKPDPEPEIEDVVEEIAEAPDAPDDYSAKLMADIESAGMAHGLDPAASRSFAADLFDSVAKCLRGDAEPEADAMDMEAEGE